MGFTAFMIAWPIADTFRRGSLRVMAVNRKTGGYLVYTARFYQPLKCQRTIDSIQN